MSELVDSYYLYCRYRLHNTWAKFPHNIFNYNTSNSPNFPPFEFRKNLFSCLTKLTYQRKSKCRRPPVYPPTLVANNFPKFYFVLSFSGHLKHEVIVRIVVHVMIFRNEIDIENPNVDLESALPDPVEVRCLCHVGHIVCGLQVPDAVKVLQENIFRSFHFQP